MAPVLARAAVQASGCLSLTQLDQAMASEEIVNKDLVVRNVPIMSL